MSNSPKTILNPVSALFPAQAMRPLAVIPSFDTLPDSAFIREAQLVQSPKRPGATAPLPFSAPTLWRKVKDCTFPKPHRLSERVTAWKVGEVRAWMAAVGRPDGSEPSLVAPGLDKSVRDLTKPTSRHGRPTEPATA